MTVLVTGGAGFIGSHFVTALVRGGRRVVNLDKLTYAGSLDNLEPLAGDPAHVFVRGDVADRALVARLLDEHRPSAIVNLAAESHVDRSIDGPADFFETNLAGTFALLEAARGYHARLPAGEGGAFRFVQVSTDEVYGSLGPEGRFTEESPSAPSSPYAASKAGADHLVRAYHRTYGLPTVTTRASNTFGPRQLPEKLLPLMILRATSGDPLPVYGDGQNVRDWLHVDDHCEALRLALDRGRPGETYNVGGGNERANLDLVRALCEMLDELCPRAGGSHRDGITFVADRPGHDRRYALDTGKIRRELGWAPARTFDEGLAHTVRWYLDHGAWCARVASHGSVRQGLAGGVR